MGSALTLARKHQISSGVLLTGSSCTFGRERYGGREQDITESIGGNGAKSPLDFGI